MDVTRKNRVVHTLITNYLNNFAYTFVVRVVLRHTQHHNTGGQDIFGGAVTSAVILVDSCRAVPGGASIAVTNCLQARVELDQRPHHTLTQRTLIDCHHLFVTITENPSLIALLSVFSDGAHQLC